MDEEAESNGTAIADAPLYSRITGVKINANIIGSQATANQFRWQLYKKPDGETLLADLSTAWHVSDDTAAQRELRKMTIAKGLAVINQSSGNAFIRFFVKRNALKRISPLREGDKLVFVIAKDAPGTTAQLTLWGNIYLKANA